MTNEWKTPVVVALLIALIYVAPHIAFHFRVHHLPDGIALMGSDAEAFYISCAREVKEGKFLSGHPTLFEHKTSFPKVPHQLLSLVPLWIFGSIWRLIGADTAIMVAIGDALFPSLFFLLCYAFLRSSGATVWFAIAGSAFPILSSLPLPEILKIGIFGREINLGKAFLYYSRPINPQISILFLISFLYACRRFICEFSNNWIKSIILGILLSLLFYANGFYAAFGYIFALFWLLAGMWKRIINLSFFIIFLVSAAVLTFPGAIVLMKTLQQLETKEAIIRSGIIFTHLPSISESWIIAVLICALLTRGFSINAWFAWCLLIANFLCANQHVITGRTVPVGYHHWWMSGGILNWWAIMLMISEGISSKQLLINWVKLFSQLVIVIAFINAIWYQWICYKLIAPIYQNLQQLRHALIWLENNTQKESVIAVDPDIAHLVTAHTSLNTYWDKMASESFISNEEVIKRQSLIAWLGGENSQTLWKHAFRSSGLPWYRLDFVMYFRKGKQLRYPPSYIINASQKMFHDTEVVILKIDWSKFKPKK